MRDKGEIDMPPKMQLIQSRWFKKECILYGPYITLKPGSYKIKFSLKPAWDLSNFFIFNKIIIAIIDITEDCGKKLLARRSITLKNYKYTDIIFNIDKVAHNIEFRVFSNFFPIFCSYERELKRLSESNIQYSLNEKKNHLLRDNLLM